MQSLDAFRPIARELKYLRDKNGELCVMYNSDHSYSIITYFNNGITSLKHDNVTLSQQPSTNQKSVLSAQCSVFSVPHVSMSLKSSYSLENHSKEGVQDSFNFGKFRYSLKKIHNNILIGFQHVESTVIASPQSTNMKKKNVEHAWGPLTSSLSTGNKQSKL